ncbi:DUF262 domain-containing protein [Campylobacter vulpis]|uniref:GmrSD restriction endonucleases N-terminal domain-containing protein n=1 Tax=Campylobacter vulpis TaxID=1655500 RepID=A0A2G4R4F5_9BACT|nr:DUF262 domain-containing protein [Campylobacter vulpis]MBS4251762.1 DUF262 domain-containing protein [Campylobacter vulpis]MBS4281461.1 DUF262 domain-containing protein [Campylobacter vulpis]MBS4330881.1 DUF262 domain-containing protein [Campylobacter vulpis]MBS4438716.1 DUF262 domain-containing protein [Campylobacter vulpis]PHY91440.1 hypothetical protein AA994_02415 [Campylobacter vulpis]
MSQNQYLRAIGDLKGENFVIPSYQRGYRWTSKEVKALLQDIWDFTQIENQPDFYCLQPIVVKKNGEEYNVIDGQQRLTTIFLLIKFLQNKDHFTITYQSRRKSTEFLKNIQHSVDREKNIDFYHFDKAYGYIKDFFENDDIDKKKFENTLIDKCKVLWYEIAKKENENEVFIRLNIGKIPLVEAENIKALFLSKNDELDSEDLKERAELWYKSEIEARENRDFRYCVLNKVDEKNIEQKSIKDDILRIDAYLKAIVPYSKEEYYLFDYFYKSYRDGTLNDRWEELEKSINTLSGFAGGKANSKIDREIFHYLGFLILSGKNIDSLYREWKNNTNKELFAKKLLEIIQEKISKIKNIEELHYKNDKEKIKDILLLFNLEYLICDEGSNEYFKFNRFVLEQWSLEHIYAQNSKGIKESIESKNNDDIIKWLEQVLLHIDENDTLLKQEIEQSKEKGKFEEELFDKINESFKNNEALHKIQNLTLLDKESNSKIGNQIFSRKRKEIQKLGEQDKLIPIATKKVFEKVFSTDKSNPDVFGKKDQKDYLAEIQKRLERYIKGEGDE